MQINDEVFLRKMKITKDYAVEKFGGGLGGGGVSDVGLGARDHGRTWNLNPRETEGTEV